MTSLEKAEAIFASDDEVKPISIEASASTDVSGDNPEVEMPTE